MPYTFNGICAPQVLVLTQALTDTKNETQLSK
jgi:hypothetical protein